MSKDKKAKQLGMNPSTASGRLIKDTLFRLAIESGHKCHQCGEELTRDTFSVEHKEHWLDSEDPVGLYFDQENIAFSHLTCNVKAGRKVERKPLLTTVCGTSAKYNRGCRCEPCTVAVRKYEKEYRSKPSNIARQKISRKDYYKRTGK